MRVGSPVSIADATLASPQHRALPRKPRPCRVSIADATLASPQQRDDAGDIKRGEFQSQTRRLLPRNARKGGDCYGYLWFQSQTRRLLPRNRWGRSQRCRYYHVSIADATLASPQPSTVPLARVSLTSFNRRRDACFPATSARFRSASY